MPKTDLLPLLADGDFHSGQELADTLGVSRTAVWKQLQRLEEMGLIFESVKGRGYRIPGGLDLLNPALIQTSLSVEARGCLGSLSLLEATDSTNAQVMKHMAAGGASGYACSAEQQTAGRGRRGRQWVSPFARNIYLSVGWEFSGGASGLEGLSLAVGVAVAQALATVGVDGVVLKWPNDVLCNNAKLGGILIEMAGDADGVCQVVVGIGLNVNMPNEQAAIDQSWIDVARLAPDAMPSRSVLLAALLNSLLPLLASWDESGFTPWREQWIARDAYADQPVVVTAGERQLAGIARGVDERGALRLETGQGIQSVFGGEVSLRLVSS